MRMPLGEGIQNQPKKKTERKMRCLPRQIAASADYYLRIIFCIVTYNNCFSKILSSNSSESYAIVGISIMNPT